MSTIFIAGLGNQRRPGFYGETVYASGSTNGQGTALVCLLIGLAGASGTITPNGAPVQITDDTQADALCGPGTELARQCYAANKIAGATVFACSPAAPGSGAAATATLTITGTLTTTGVYRYRICGEQREVALTAGMTPTACAAAIVADVTGRARWPVTAANAAGVVTFTHRTLSVSGNYQRIVQDLTGAPAGFAATLTSATGGTLANVSGGIFMDGGVGTPDLTTLLGVLAPASYDRIAPAAQDATALGALRAAVDADAGPTIGFLQHVITASNKANSVAQGLARTTLNDQRFQHIWQLNGETHPAEVAAANAALRASIELQDPNHNYDDNELVGVAPQDPADAPSPATIEACLANGITPLITSLDRRVRICRAITTRCMTSSGSPDDSTLDLAVAWIPDFVRGWRLRPKWENEFKANNPAVGPDDPNGKEPPGMATPRVWNAAVNFELRALEKGEGFPGPVLVAVDTHPPVTVYDTVNKRLMSAVPTVAAPQQHSIGVSVRSAA